jgi:hypothetical protein
MRSMAARRLRLSSEAGSQGAEIPSTWSLARMAAHLASWRLGTPS